MAEELTGLKEEMVAAIRSCRYRSGLSQRELAEKLGLNEVSLSKIELGWRIPSLDLCGRIFDALGVEISLKVDCDD